MNKDSVRGQRLVLLERGAEDETRAAWFEPAHVIDLLQAARAGGFHMVEVGAAALCTLDPNVAAGQLLGPATISPLPPVRRSTFDALFALPPLLQPPRQLVSQATALNRSGPASVHLPKQIIRVGSIVLASVAKEDGWWEAEVVDIAPENLLRLRWRDFPGLDTFERRFAAVAVVAVGGSQR